MPWIERIRSVMRAFIGPMLALTYFKFLGELSGLDEWLRFPWEQRFTGLCLARSPMAQPWAVITGNTISALVGVSIVHLVHEPLLAMPLAASLSILGMFYYAAYTLLQPLWP